MNTETIIGGSFALQKWLGLQLQWISLLQNGAPMGICLFVFVLHLVVSKQANKFAVHTAIYLPCGTNTVALLVAVFLRDPQKKSFRK